MGAKRTTSARGGFLCFIIFVLTRKKSDTQKALRALYSTRESLINPTKQRKRNCNHQVYFSREKTDSIK